VKRHKRSAGNPEALANGSFLQETKKKAKKSKAHDPLKCFIASLIWLTIDPGKRRSGQELGTCEAFPEETRGDHKKIRHEELESIRSWT